MAKQTIPDSGLWSVIAGLLNGNFDQLFQGVVVIINQESDFPTQDATTITLEANTKYIMGTFVSTAKRFIVEDSAVLAGPGSSIPILNYTGSGTMFTSKAATDVSFTIMDMDFACPTATVFDMTTTGSNFFIFRNCAITQCLNIGTFNQTGVFMQGTSVFQTNNTGFTLAGASHNGFLMTDCQLIGTTAAFVGIDLGTIVTTTFRVLDSTIIGPPGSVAIKGAAGSANISAGNRAVIETTNLTAGGITPLSGITNQDIRWFFSEVTGLTNSSYAADAYITAQETVTVTVQSEFYEVDGGNWANTVQNKFTTAADGTITYNGEQTIDVRLSGAATVSKVGGGSDQIEVRFGINWTAADPGLERSGTVTQNTSPTSVPLEALVTIAPDDDIRMIVANNGSTSDIVVDRASIVITEV